MKISHLVAGAGILISACFSASVYAQNISVTPGGVSVEGGGANINVQGGKAAGVNVNTAPGRTSGQTQVDVQGGNTAGVAVGNTPPASGAKKSASPRRTQNQTQVEVNGGGNVNVIASDGGYAETRVGQKVITSGGATRVSGNSARAGGGVVQQHTGDMVNLDLSEQNFSGHDFSRRQISNVNFEAAVLQNASFSGSSLANVNFNDADLRGANFSGASLANVSVNDALLDDAIWADGRVCGKRSVGKCR